MRRFIPMLAVAAIAVGLVACQQQMAMSDQKAYKAHLTAASEVPPVNSAGVGDAALTLDTKTKQLSWTVKFSGLTGPAIAAHIHGPAAMGVNAGVAIPFDGVPAATSGEIKGSKVLTDAQIADLDGGKFYVNIHTPNNKGGEIRGQVGP